MDISEINQIIKEFGISMPKLAKKMNISASSFKKKIDPNYGHRFSSSELEKLEGLVIDLKSKIEVAI